MDTLLRDITVFMGPVHVRKLMYRKTTNYRAMPSYLHVLSCHGKVFVAGGVYRGGFCAKLLEASPMSDRTDVSQLQDRLTTGQGQAHQ